MTRDAFMLLVDQALLDAGVTSGATVVEFNAALVLAETQGLIRRADGAADNEAWVVRGPAV